MKPVGFLGRNVNDDPPDNYEATCAAAFVVGLVLGAALAWAGSR